MPLDILIFALVAAFLVHRLRSVLGARHGDERQRQNPFEKHNEPHAGDNIVSVAAGHAGHYDLSASSGSGGLDNGMVQIAIADNQFDAEEFLDGARQAFPMVVQAFADGKREILRGLLSEDLFTNFDQALDRREKEGHKLFTEVLSVKADPIEARLKDNVAYITVRFEAEETTYVKDQEGNVVEGDPNGIIVMKDIWTFARDVRSRDPNWTLVATRQEESEDKKEKTDKVEKAGEDPEE